jgi:type I restriction enzyme S subunit
MSRGRKSFSSSITDNWEKAFFNSIGHYITLINKGLSKSFKSEPLSNHIKIVGGFAFKNAEYKSSGIPIIRISDFNNERIVLDDVVYYKESPLLEKYEIKESDIIIALTGGTIGKLGIVQAGLGKLYLNQRVGKFDILNADEFEKEYIYWIARGVESIVKNLAWGAAIPNVSPKQIEDLNFPIPTKDIQKNIIRFLNELKNGSVNDKIYFDEEIEDEIKDIQEKQVKAREVQDELSYQLTLLENLNHAILQGAVQGKLVKQDIKDEPASELLKRIKAEKAKSGKKEKPLPPIKPEEIPFAIPENWVWCWLGEICEIKRGKGPKYSENGIPKMLNQKCVRWYEIDLQYCKSVDADWFHSISEDFIVRENDVLVNSTGDGTIGRSAIAHKEVEGYIYDSHILKITSIISQMFICYYINSNYGQEQVNKSKGATSTKQHELGVNNLSNFTFPLPPLSEQKRIVAEIEKQFAKTKQLKEHIIANQQATEQLLKALLHQAFEVKEVETA